jgi:hypothetical protein
MDRAWRKCRFPAVESAPAPAGPWSRVRPAGPVPQQILGPEPAIVRRALAICGAGSGVSGGGPTILWLSEHPRLLAPADAMEHPRPRCWPRNAPRWRRPLFGRKSAHVSLRFGESPVHGPLSSRRSTWADAGVDSRLRTAVGGRGSATPARAPRQPPAKRAPDAVAALWPPVEARPRRSDDRTSG